MTVIASSFFICHCEERSDEAIRCYRIFEHKIATLRSQ